MELLERRGTTAPLGRHLATGCVRRHRMIGQQQEVAGESRWERRSRPSMQLLRAARRAGSAIMRPDKARWGETRRSQMSNEEFLPDVRDGLTRRERIVLKVLHELRRERGELTKPTPLVWGRVCEHFYIDPAELSHLLARLGARRSSGSPADSISEDE